MTSDHGSGNDQSQDKFGQLSRNIGGRVTGVTMSDPSDPKHYVSAPPEQPMTAAQMHALQEAAKRMGEDINLRKWCVEQAIDASTQGDCRNDLVLLAAAMHRFIVGQSGSS